MTDNEIIKAYECCNKIDNGKNCWECPYRQYCPDCLRRRNEDTIDLINRQKAEIERLQKENEILSTNADNAFQEGLNENRALFKQEVEAEIRAEAVKEVFERLKEAGARNNAGLILFVEKDLDSIFKEAAGETNAG